MNLNIGKSDGTNINWNCNDAEQINQHALIVGMSGTGKTHALKYLLSQINDEDITAVIIDISGSYSSEKLERNFLKKLDGKIKIVDVYKEGINVNLFQKYKINSDTYEKSSDVASRVSEIIGVVYKMGVQQKAKLYRAISNVLGDNFRNNFKCNTDNEYADDITWGDGLPCLDLKLIRYLLREINDSAAEAVISKLECLIDCEVFNNSDKNNEYEARLIIYKLENYSMDIKEVVTELMLWDLWNSQKMERNNDKNLIIVVDECQLMRHDQKSIIAKMLTEGRKFGIGLWLGTQFISNNFKRDEIARLKQASLQLIFRPHDEECTTVGKMLDRKMFTQWEKVLRKLKKGECVAKGRLNINNDRISKDKALIVQVPNI